MQPRPAFDQPERFRGEIRHRVGHHHQLVFIEAAIDEGEFDRLIKAVTRFGEGPERIMRENVAAIDVRDAAAHSCSARRRMTISPGSRCVTISMPPPCSLEMREERRPVDGMERMRDEIDDRLDDDQPTRLGAPRQRFDVMAETQAEDDKIMGTVVADLAADLLDAAIDQELAERVVQLHADGTDKPGACSAAP